MRHMSYEVSSGTYSAILIFCDPWDLIRMTGSVKGLLLFLFRGRWEEGWSENLAPSLSPSCNLVFSSQGKREVWKVKEGLGRLRWH